jgi:hypothetical protein
VRDIIFGPPLTSPAIRIAPRKESAGSVVAWFTYRFTSESESTETINPSLPDPAASVIATDPDALRIRGSASDNERVDERHALVHTHGRIR